MVKGKGFAVMDANIIQEFLELGIIGPSLVIRIVGIKFNSMRRAHPYMFANKHSSHHRKHSSLCCVTYVVCIIVNTVVELQIHVQVWHRMVVNLLSSCITLLKTAEQTVR